MGHRDHGGQGYVNHSVCQSLAGFVAAEWPDVGDTTRSMDRNIKHSNESRTPGGDSAWPAAAARLAYLRPKRASHPNCDRRIIRTMTAKETAGKRLLRELDAALPSNIEWTPTERTTLASIEVMANRLDALRKRCDTAIADAEASPSRISMLANAVRQTRGEHARVDQYAGPGDGAPPKSERHQRAAYSRWNRIDGSSVSRGIASPVFANTYSPSALPLGTSCAPPSLRIPTGLGKRGSS